MPVMMVADIDLQQNKQKKNTQYCSYKSYAEQKACPGDLKPGQPAL
jgi:hypothetical protein